jgi:UDP-glucose 4-epimerase
MNQKILIIGGAGYIGSHMTQIALNQGIEVDVYDNLSTGYRDAIDTRAAFIEGDIANTDLLSRVLSKNYNGIIHFASSIQVGESVVDPGKYWINNVTNSLNLLECMRSKGANKIIFSSTAAIFGNPITSPISEEHPTSPINPYGKTKLTIENALSDYFHAYGICSVSLRYFNAAGASKDGSLGERHNPETHLIPLVLQSASGRSGPIKIFGSDYPTVDGTCIRDYVHVIDLCHAHLLALEYLISNPGCHAFNLGSGQGFSVNEVVETAKIVTGCKVPSIVIERRKGDPAILVADPTLAKQKLGWAPKYTDLSSMIEDAWRWELQLK